MKRMNKKVARACTRNRIKHIVSCKHAAEMAIGTLVIIVLAVIVLVVLALGFGMGWSTLWSKLTGYISPVNVDSVKQACAYACTTSGTYAYCEEARTVNMANNQKRIGSCETLKSIISIDACPAITCGTNVYKTECSDLGGVWESACEEKPEITPPPPIDTTDRKSIGLKCCPK